MYQTVNEVVDKLAATYGLETKEVLILHTVVYQLYNSAAGYSLEELHKRFDIMFRRVQQTTQETLAQVRQTMN